MASGVPGSPPGLPGPLRSAPPPSKGGTSEPSSSRLGDRPNPRHILWAASRLQEPLRDICALSWCRPDRKRRHRCRPELLLNQPGGGHPAVAGQPPHRTAHAGVHTHTHIHTHTYAHIHIHTHHLHTSTHSYLYTHMLICIYTLITYTHSRTHTYIYTLIHICTRILIHTHSYTHTHTLIYTQSYTHNHNIHS